jgi:hypothetical protein
VCIHHQQRLLWYCQKQRNLMFKLIWMMCRFFLFFRPGGQSVNTTKSAVRLTHIPTGLVRNVRIKKSQNKDKAFGVLRSVYTNRN